MYRVYSDSTMIHDGSSPDLKIHLIDPKLSMAENAAGQFDMTIPPHNPGYNVVERFNSTIYVKKEGQTIWSGRVITENKDYWNRRKLTLEGALAFLNDTNQPVHTYYQVNLTTFITTLLANHNAKVAANRRIQLGIVTVNDMSDDHIYQTNYGNTWEEFQTNCLDRLGGHVRIRYEDGSDTPLFDYLREWPNTAAQTIDFGKNLLDFARDWDFTDIATVIIPRGKQLDEENEDGQKDYVTVASVNGGSIYVINSDAMATYGRIEKIVDFSDVEEPSTLLALANLYISNQQFDEMVMSVNALDMHKMTRDLDLYLEDSSYVDVTDSNDAKISGYLKGVHDSVEPNQVGFKLFDNVRCISRPHGLDRYFPITRMDIPLDKPDSVVYTMGAVVSTTLSASVKATRDLTLERISELPAVTTILGLAKQEAAQILNQRTTGYVTITEVSEASEAIIISETQDWTEANKYWMFNMNGLGYTRDAGQTYDIAITMDGSIVADFIKTGLLEDGYGLNFWNLATGEFSLSTNTAFRQSTDPSDPVLTIVDVNTLANTANTNAVNAGDAANTANTNAIKGQLQQTSSANILNGTNKLESLQSVSEWAQGTWSGLGESGIRTVEDVSDAPNPNIKKGVYIKKTAASQDTLITYIVQKNVPMLKGQVYVISCYAKGDGKLAISVEDSTRGGAVIGSITRHAVTADWKRYLFTVQFESNLFTEKVNVCFGNCGAQNSIIHICGMMMNRGNAVADWDESAWDTLETASEYTDDTAEVVMSAAIGYTDDTSEKLETFTRAYVAAISDNDREFTKEQRQALDESFTQAKVLARLTNNYQARGIYLSNGQLLMNADYIRTGTLDAGIVKTGILTDARNVNKWNMATGYLYTKNMEAVNAKLSGTFECGSSYKIQLSNGTLYGYQGNTYVGSIDYSANMVHVDTGVQYKGLMLRAKGGMQIRMPSIAVRKYNDNGIATTGWTGKKEFWFVTSIHDIGNGAISWNSNTHGIECINGIVVSAW